MSLYPSYLLVSDRRYRQEQEPAPRPPVWMHREDVEIGDSSWGGGVRPCAPCPAVWVLKDNPNAVMTRQWQYYIRAINYNMTIANAYLLLDDHLAFANDTGFRDLDNPGKRDYFFNRTNFAKDPNLDKVRTCSRSLMTGTVVGGYLQVQTLDSQQDPPLKPGRAYPRDISEVNPDDYLYMPQTHPWMFVAATITNKRGETVQFPRGGLYPWFMDGRSPVSWMPLVSNHSQGVVLYPLSRLRLIGASEPLPGPYRQG